MYREVITLADRQKTVEDDDVTAIVARVRAASADAPVPAAVAGDRA